MPGGHRGLHEYLLDISHWGTHILQKKWERGGGSAESRSGEHGSMGILSIYYGRCVAQRTGLQK